MPGPVFLDGNDIELRTIESEDSEFLQRTINDSQVRSSLAAVSPRNREQKSDWVQSRGEDGSVALLVCADGDPVGTVALNPPNETWGVGEVAYMIAPDYWNNGYATEAVTLVCRYAFEERRLNKVCAAPFATNAASCRVLEKVGFTEEGTLREEAFIGGEHVDVRRYGVLADEWFQE